MNTGHPMRGIRGVMKLAEQKIYAEAPQALSPERQREMKEAAGRTLFIAGNYPGEAWREAMGYEPDLKRHYQVTVGIAVAPGRAANLLARAFISRDPDDDFCHIVWNPPA